MAITGIGLILGISTVLMPVLVLGAAAGAYLISQSKIKFRSATGVAIIVCSAVIGAGSWYNSSRGLDTHGRYRVWKMVVNYFIEHDKLLPPDSSGHRDFDMPEIPVIYGAGTGIGQVAIPHIQQINGDDGSNHGLFLWLHSDWLQLLFENGIVGLFLGISLLVSVLIRSFDRPYLFTSIIGYAVTMLGNYPFHMAYQAFFGMFLVARAFQKDSKKLTDIGDGSSPAL